MERGASIGRRAPASWVPEEHVITECYPVFPTHVVDYPHARHDKSWVEDVRRELSTLCDDMPIVLVRSNEIGKDVALLFARKA